MDFFQAQDAARTRTRWLVVLFIAAVAAIIAAVYLLLHVTFGPGPDGSISLELLAAVAAGTILLVTVASTTRTMQLREGGSRVAEMLGGRRVRPNTTDERERRLVNVVEEMAIASGTPMPAIYVLDHEPGINAFAAGYTLDDAAVAVTRGTLESLNREELQGVIAHEFSHILNGDMRLNIRLIGLLFGILVLAVIGRGLLHGGRYGGRGRRDGAAQVALVGLGLIAIGYIGVLFGRLIQAAVSRQREFLADASAVQFTRDPDGIAGALRRIGAAAAGSRIRNHHAAEAGHLFFANGISGAFTSLLATHPPLDERIRRIDKSFREQYGPATLLAPTHPAAAFAAPQPAASVDAARQAIVTSVGSPRAENIAFAHALLERLPAEVVDAAHDPVGAQALLYALLMPEADARQLSIVELTSEEIAGRAARIGIHVRPLGTGARLPLLDILLPALRTLSPPERAAVRLTAGQLIRADRRIDAFEFAVYHVLARQLADEVNASDAARVTERSLSELRDEVRLVLSALAWAGTADAPAAHNAFEAGAKLLSWETGALQLADRSDVALEMVDAALDRLRHATPRIRQRVIEACVHVVTSDGSIREAEAEMVRAVSEALDCPIPPLGGARPVS